MPAPFNTAMDTGQGLYHIASRTEGQGAFQEATGKNAVDSLTENGYNKQKLVSCVRARRPGAAAYETGKPGLEDLNGYSCLVVSAIIKAKVSQLGY